MAEQGDIIDLRGVSVAFEGSPVLEDVNLSVGEGDFLAVLGPNGGGKTTLIKVILGLVSPDTGSVSVLGTEPAKARPMIGYLPQFPRFDPSFPITVLDVVLMGRYRGLFRRYSKEDRRAALKALDTVGMSGKADRQFGSLSGGQRQRVYIARAIVKKPRLLLLDEPLTSVDPEMQSSFYRLLAGLRDSMAVVMVTHDIGVVSSEVDRVACISRRLYYHGPPGDSLDHVGDLYGCPVEVVAHGVPHRVLEDHGGCPPPPDEEEAAPKKDRREGKR